VYLLLCYAPGGLGLLLFEDVLLLLKLKLAVHALEQSHQLFGAHGPVGSSDAGPGGLLQSGDQVQPLERLELGEADGEHQ